MFKKFFAKINREVIFYLIFGVLTTLIDYLVFIIFEKFLKINYIVANIFAWFFAVLFAYFTNKFWVFKSTLKKDNLLKEIFSFFSLRIVSLIIAIVFMLVTVEIFNFNKLISKILSSVFVIIINYFFSKLFIFNKKGEENE